MSQQEFLETSRYYEETGAHEAQEPVEAIREYSTWEQNNKFATRHLLGEKVQPPDNKSGAWSLIPLIVLLFLIGGGAFGLTAAFHSAYSAPSPWNGDDFAPGPEWHHHYHHPHCQIIPDTDHQFGPDSTGMQGNVDSHFYIVEHGSNFCGRP